MTWRKAAIVFLALALVAVGIPTQSPTARQAQPARPEFSRIVIALSQSLEGWIVTHPYPQVAYADETDYGYDEPTPEPTADPSQSDYDCMMMPETCAASGDESEPLTAAASITSSITLTDTDGVTTTFSFDPGEWLPTSNSDPCGGYYAVDWSRHGLQTTMLDGGVYTTIMAQICVDVRTGAETATYTVCPGACGVGLVPVVAWDSTGDGQPAQAGVVGSMFWRMCLEGVGTLPKGGPALQLIDGVCLMLAYLTDAQGVCGVSTSLLVAVTHLKAHTTDMAIIGACTKLQGSLSLVVAASCQAAAGP